MNIQLILAALVAASLAMPAAAVPVASPASSGLHGQDVVAVAAKKKTRPKKRRVLRNPRNGDVYVGPVEGFHTPDWKNARRVREGNDLGGLIGRATNNFMFNGVPRGGHTRRTGPNEVPDGGYGQTCGPQYWTSTPTSPAC